MTQEKSESTVFTIVKILNFLKNLKSRLKSLYFFVRKCKFLRPTCLGSLLNVEKFRRKSYINILITKSFSREIFF